MSALSFASFTSYGQDSSLRATEPLAPATALSIFSLAAVQLIVSD